MKTATADAWNGSHIVLDESACPICSRENCEGCEPAEPRAAVEADSLPLTEAGAAERFASAHGDNLRYDHLRRRWLIWQAHRWVPDVDAAVTRIGLEFARTWQRRSTDIPDRARKEDTFRAAVRLERLDTLRSMLALASALRPLADDGTKWDRDPYLLGVPNGVVDLRTGRLRAGRRDDAITMTAGVSFDAHALCPRWERFLVEVFRGEHDLINYVTRAIGYSLSGDVREQVFFFPHGGGANGKGTCVNTLRHVLGDYAHALPFSALEHDPRPGAASNELAALQGRRFVVSSESSDGRRLDEGRLKWITGSDPIRARFLYQESFEFIPAAKFWLSANHKPIVHDDSHGFWRRVRLIPFVETFDVNSEPNLEDTLRREAPGILAWAVRACLAWQQEGLRAPAVVLAATLDYRRESDPLAAFLDEACELRPGAEVPAAELFAHYQTWAKTQGFSPREQLSATKFGRLISEKFERDGRRSGRTYLGLIRRPLRGTVVGLGQ